MGFMFHLRSQETKFKTSRGPWLPRCFGNTAPLPLGWNVVQIAGPDWAPTPPLSWRCRPAESSQLGEVSWRTSMLPGPRNIWKEPRRGGQDSSARGTSSSAPPGLSETLTLHPEPAKSLQPQSRLSGLLPLWGLDRPPFLALAIPPPLLCTETHIQNIQCVLPHST